MWGYCLLTYGPIPEKLGKSGQVVQNGKHDRPQQNRLYIIVEDCCTKIFSDGSIALHLSYLLIGLFVPIPKKKSYRTIQLHCITKMKLLLLSLL